MRREGGEGGGGRGEDKAKGEVRTGRTGTEGGPR